MVVGGGYNVYPRGIEEAIFKHPAVEEVCVIGVKDAYRGQSPKAFVKLKGNASALTLDELKLFLKDKLGKHEMLQAMEIRSDLPKTPVGKFDKKKLYEEEDKRAASSRRLRREPFNPPPTRRPARWGPERAFRLAWWAGAAAASWRAKWRARSCRTSAWSSRLEARLPRRPRAMSVPCGA